MADTGLNCRDDERELELAPLRFAMAVATRAQRVATTIDVVKEAIGDAQRPREDAQHACIYPCQAAGVHEAMASNEAELDWTCLRGRCRGTTRWPMVQAPVVIQARRTPTGAGRA